MTYYMMQIVNDWQIKVSIFNYFQYKIIEHKIFYF